MSCPVCWRKNSQLSELACYLLSLSFYGTLSICIYHWVSKTQVGVGIYFCQDSFVAPEGYQNESDLPGLFKVFLPGKSTPWPSAVSVFLLATKTALIGILCLWWCKRKMSRFGPSLRCCWPPGFTYFTNPGGHFKWAYGDICLSNPITFQTWKGFWWASMCPTLMYSSNFHRTVPHMGIF